MLVWTAIIIVFTPLCFQDKSSGSFYYAKLSFSLQEMKIPSSEYKYPRARVPSFGVTLGHFLGKSTVRKGAT